MKARTEFGFEPESHIPTRGVIAFLVALGVVLWYVGEALPAWPRIEGFVLIVLMASIVAWLLHTWKPWVGNWLVLVELGVLVWLARVWLAVPGSLALMVVPTVAAAGLISMAGSIAAAAGLTVVLLTSWQIGIAGVGVAETGIALGSVWAVLAVMYTVHWRMWELSAWVWRYYHEAQVSLETARDRQGELNQIIADLADANLQLARLNQLAQGLRTVAEDARRAKAEFVANVSHEFRHPLNMIIGFSEMMLGTPEIYVSDVPPALMADIAVIHRNSQHLLSLINDVLDLSQVEAGRMALERQPGSVGEVVEEAVLAVRPLFESKDLYLDVEMPELPPLACDRARIRQVLLNLLSNAGRFTERGGVKVRAWHDENKVVVSVADTGPGIAPEHQERVFEPFRQVDGSTRRRQGGSGLGLTISKRFIEMHGGEMWLESQVGVGTTFCFCLPVQVPIPIDDTAWRWLGPYGQYETRSRPSTAPKPELKPRYVVVERDDTLSHLLERYLHGAEIVPVRQGEAAIRELERSPADAIVVNSVSMGEAFAAVHQLAEASPHTPVVACSVPGKSDVARDLGVRDYLVKPVDRETLLAALESLGSDVQTVLLVDDETEALHLFTRMLASSGRGYRILRAMNGQRALNLLRDRRPDVVLLDLVMPGLDGFQLLEQKQQDVAIRDIPVIAVSGRDPFGEPIVSRTLMVARHPGLSVHELVNCIRGISEVLSPPRPGGQAHPERSAA